MSEVTDLPAIESTPTQNSTKLVTSGGIFAALAQKAAAVHSHVMSDITGLVDALAAKADAIHSHVMTDITGLTDDLAAKMNSMTVDSSPANNADHLVSSKGVYNALAGKMDTMTVDNTPTANSNNLVKSGGVYAAIQAALQPAINVFAQYLGSSSQILSISQTGTLPLGIFIIEMPVKRYSYRDADFVGGTSIVVRFEIYGNTNAKIYYNDALFAHKTGNDWTVDYNGSLLVPAYYGPAPSETEWIELTPEDETFNTGQKFYKIEVRGANYDIWQGGSTTRRVVATGNNIGDGVDFATDHGISTNYDNWPYEIEIDSTPDYTISAKS